MLVIVMGVTASGKSTVAQELVKRTGWAFAEGDDYHSAANVAKMKAGIPLTDEDRAPWLAALHAVLAAWQAAGKSGVMTCSALRASYRDVLAEGFDSAALRFVLLEVPKVVLADRLAHRRGHYMNPALLDSQLATLEVPANALHIPADRPPAETAEAVLKALGAVRLSGASDT